MFERFLQTKHKLHDIGLKHRVKLSSVLPFRPKLRFHFVFNMVGLASSLLQSSRFQI